MSKLYNEIYKLKNLCRKGWVIRNAKDNETGRTESDAEHTFSMCLLAMEIMGKEKLDLNQEKVLKMCLVHELCEIDAGDVTPFDDVTLEEKFRCELCCVERLSAECEMPEILLLWQEFEDMETPEAKFVKIIDKLDAVMQAKIYSEKTNNPEIFEEFYNRAYPLIKDFVKYI